VKKNKTPRRDVRDITKIRKRRRKVNTGVVRMKKIIKNGRKTRKINHVGRRKN